MGKRPREEDVALAAQAPSKKKAKPAPPSPSESDSEASSASDYDSASEGGGAGGGAGGAAGAIATVYLEGIPRDSTEDDIRAFLAGVGDILEVRAPKYQDSGRLLGYAHVDFPSAAEAKKAVATKDGRYMGERFISVSLANAKDGVRGGASAASLRPRPAGCTTAFIKGLPYDMDEAGLSAAVAEHGAVKSARIVRWNHTGASKGFGYVQFEHGFSADALMKAAAAGLKIGGRRVQVDFDTGAPRASFKTATGRSFYRTDEAKVAGIKRPVGAGESGGAGGAPTSSGGAAKPGATAIRRPAKTDVRG